MPKKEFKAPSDPKPSNTRKYSRGKAQGSPTFSRALMRGKALKDPSGQNPMAGNAGRAPRDPQSLDMPKSMRPKGKSSPQVADTQFMDGRKRKKKLNEKRAKLDYEGILY